MEWLMLGGAALSALGQYEQGQQAKARGQLIQSQDEYAAQQEIQRGAQETNYLQRVAVQRQGEGVASAGASGVDVTRGSPLMVLADQNRQAQENMALTLSNAQHRALALRLGGAEAEQSGEAAAAAGTLGAIGSGLMGGARAGSLSSRGSGSPYDAMG